MVKLEPTDFNELSMRIATMDSETFDIFKKLGFNDVRELIVYLEKYRS